MTSYLPRPVANRTGQDVDEIYALVLDELQHATAENRGKIFRNGLLRAYEAGIDAQREVVHNYPHDHPTPLPTHPPEELEEDLEDTVPGLPKGVFRKRLK